ncbi:aspartate aminotransferase family protein [Amylibacter sp. SFDW26]|uniref:aspartate aminotransferase family protein n=1 Tax=Amylibacter sp. SFDW26 TaxID=2652722 RepID=UPI0012617E86|nr:aspartate aminotransferase family protein [Amylibacter sp. SFDW26]KAB7613784.1 aspartate aminotransferase family protein [Amylibacter sp. SFDW26]
MSHVFPRHTKANLPTAVAGDGCYLIDKDGKRYFDGSGGAAVSCLGHSNERVISAVQSQVGKLAFAHTGFLTSNPAEELADLLIEHAPGALDRVYFVSGGSEAVEAAIKLSRQYHLENGEPQREHIIARKQSYHGNTLGALAVGGNQWRRQQFDPLLINISHISPCYEYIGRGEDETRFDYGQRMAQELEDKILQLGTDKVMAFIAEPVVGATLGAVAAVEGYFKRIREICNVYGVHLILDEVMCGMGRTGHLFACEKDNVDPDFVCIAKGLGAGYQPIGAMLCTSQIYEAIQNGTGFFQHGHTYIGHPVAAAAGVAVVKEILENGLVNRVRTMGQKLQTALKAEFAQHQHVGDIRGRGLFQGIEFVKNRSTKEPFPATDRLAGKIKKAAFEAGLICYPMPGTRDGKVGDHVLLAPPFILDDAQIDEIIMKLSQAVDKSIKV